MKSKRFDRIVIMGDGKIAGDILTYLNDLQQSYKFLLEYIEHEIHRFSVIGKICQIKKIAFNHIYNKEELVSYLDAIQEKVLIISAYNTFLFPRRVVEKENVIIINYHNALLPAYPGRNAPSWAIFMGEEKTGITWHYVTSSIDAGNIIWQKQCAIGENMKAYQLDEILMQLAFEGFKEIFAGVFSGIVDGRMQCIAADRRIYHSWEVPGDGRFSLEEPSQNIYRLLRSTDFGKANIFPRMRTVYQGEDVEIVRYRKINKDEITEGNNILYLPYDGDKLLRMKYQRVVE